MAASATVSAIGASGVPATCARTWAPLTSVSSKYSWVVPWKSTVSPIATPGAAPVKTYTPANRPSVTVASCA